MGIPNGERLSFGAEIGLSPDGALLLSLSNGAEVNIQVLDHYDKPPIWKDDKTFSGGNEYLIPTIKLKVGYIIDIKLNDQWSPSRLIVGELEDKTLVLRHARR